jgi:hypothetical protein
MASDSLPNTPAPQNAAPSSNEVQPTDKLPIPTVEQSNDETSTTESGDLTASVGKIRHGADIIIFFIAIAGITLGMLILQYFLILNAGSAGSIISLPIDILGQTLTWVAGIFGGFESAHAFGKSAALPKGESVKLPDWKIKQLQIFIVTFIILTLAAIILQYLSKSTSVNFYSSTFAYGIAASFIVYVCGRTGSKLGENLDFLKDTGLFKGMKFDGDKEEKEDSSAAASS